MFIKKKTVEFLFTTNLINGIVVGQVTSGIPAIKIPPFHTKIDDKTLYFTDMITHIGTTIIALPLISILESIAVAKAFCKHCFFLFSLLFMMTK